MKKITAFLLTLLALVFVFPVLFLAVGSLMGKNELTDLLLPVLKTGSTGYASWKLFPEYPTLRSYVEVLLDSPEFFVMFWNSVKITLGALAGELLVGMPAAWGFAKFDFPGKKGLFTLYIALMMMPFQVMLLGKCKQIIFSCPCTIILPDLTAQTTGLQACKSAQINRCLCMSASFNHSARNSA